jgi:hypothetical protein
MATETLKAWFMAEAFADKVKVFFNVILWRSANIDLLAAATFLATNFNMHCSLSSSPVADPLPAYHDRPTDRKFSNMRREVCYPQHLVGKLRCLSNL